MFGGSRVQQLTEVEGVTGFDFRGRREFVIYERWGEHCQ